MRNQCHLVNITGANDNRQTYNMHPKSTNVQVVICPMHLRFEVQDSEHHRRQ